MAMVRNEPSVRKHVGSKPPFQKPEKVPKIITLSTAVETVSFGYTSFLSHPIQVSLEMWRLVSFCEEMRVVRMEL
jgi:hypothetical protein